MKTFVMYLFLVLNCFISNGQTNNEQEEHEMKGSHRVTVGLGHAHVSEGKVDGDTKWLVLASWSLNYDYWLSNKWAIGLQNDIILESYVIETSHQEEIARHYPIAVVPVAVYKPGKHLSFIGGLGGEFANGENLTLIRLGAEYGWHLPKNWEIGGALVYDNKLNYYNSWGIALTISKIMLKKH